MKRSFAIALLVWVGIIAAAVWETARETGLICREAPELHGVHVSEVAAPTSTLTQTWTKGGTTFYAYKLDVTPTPSAIDTTLYLGAPNGTPIPMPVIQRTVR